MSKKGFVYLNDTMAGTLEYRDNAYIFTYDHSFFNDPALPSISITLPKTKKEYRSELLFPFFYGLLAEGTDKQLQCKILKIDERDHFTRLLRTAQQETIGAVTVREAT